MAESTGQKGARRFRAVLAISFIVAGLAATTALAASVTQAPTISDDPLTGMTVTATRGAWTPSTAKAEYGWLRCDKSGLGCAAISGACGQSYEVRTADQGHTLRVRLTATEPGGQADSKDSAPTKEVPEDPYPERVEGKDTCTKVTSTGPGQGTFNSGTQTGPGTTPSPDTTLDFIDPFPVVRIAGRFKGKKTKLTRVTVRAPKGTRISVSCKGKGCPYKRKAIAVKLVKIRALQRTYRPKATIEVRVTQPKKIGKYTRVRTRKGKAPLRLDRCLMPGKTKPVRCPTG